MLTCIYTRKHPPEAGKDGRRKLADSLFSRRVQAHLPHKACFKTFTLVYMVLKTTFSGLHLVQKQECKKYGTSCRSCYNSDHVINH